MAQAFLNGVQYNDPNTASIVQFIERTITEINIPEGVTSIGRCAFYDCQNAEGMVTIPEGVWLIGQDAFNNCIRITEIKLPQSVTTLHGYVFSNMKALKRLILPSKVTYLTTAIVSNSGIEEFVALGDITWIGVHVFKNCGKCLKYDFTHCTSVPPLGGVSSFEGINAEAKILVPASLYNEWIVATNWAEYANHIVPDIPVMEIPDYVSEGLEIEGNSVLGRGSCTDSVVVINEDDTVNRIFSDAFCRDQAIEELYILGSITTIEDSVCSGSSLKRLYMENVSYISSPTLNADALEYVRFSKNISHIGEASLRSKNKNIIYDFSAFEGEEIPTFDPFAPEGSTLSPGIILVPAERCEEWKAATNWSYYADKILPVD